MKLRDRERFPPFHYIVVDSCTIIVDERGREASNSFVVPRGSSINVPQRIKVPLDLHPRPFAGDHLKIILKSGVASSNLRNIVEPEIMEYVRLDVSIGTETFLTQIVEKLNAETFVIFNNSMGCNLSFLSSLGYRKPRYGVPYVLSVVESTQPESCTWRVYDIKEDNTRRNRLEQQIPTYNDEFVSCEPVECILGSLEFGRVKYATIKMKNWDTANPRCLQTVKVVGCYADKRGCVRISQPHKEKDLAGVGQGHEDLRFFPSAEYTSGRNVGVIVQPDSSICVTVMFSAAIAGLWNFLVQLHMDTNVDLQCEFKIDVLDKDGKECQNVVASPDMDHIQARRLLLSDDRKRTKEMADLRLLPINDRIDQMGHDFRIPASLMDFLNTDPSRNELYECLPVLKESLTIENYKERMHLLLHLEEYSRILSQRSLDRIMTGSIVPLGGTRARLLLDVGQEIKTPFCWEGDRIVLKRSRYGRSTKSYEGIVTEVEPDSVVVNFYRPLDRDFVATTDPLHVTFMLERSCFIRQHAAIEAVNGEVFRKILFPTQLDRDESLPVNHDSQGFRSTLQKCFLISSPNEQQTRAVLSMVSSVCCPISYVLCGPPGTGKSVTLLEVILHVLLTDVRSRLLVCAPTNNAVDYLALQLLRTGLVDQNSLVRLLAASRSKDSVPWEVQSCCQSSYDRCITETHQIILTTCSSAFHAGEVPFTHIIVDEAACASEPETLIPISVAAGLRNERVKIILAGDPMQLGAQINSNIAVECGLHVSLLERLLSSAVYGPWQNERFCPHIMTRLEVNYRLPASILKIPSHLFYSGFLRTTVSLKRPSDQEWWLSGITFWPSRSRQQRRFNSFSISNKGQAVIVQKLVKLLLEAGFAKDDIGIITPYRLQVDCIKKQLLEADPTWEFPMLGTVDEYQGKEKPVIIISTVRDFSPHAKDLTSLLGFVSSPKRINVSLTRAQRTLMIVGDPYALIMDKNWRAIVRFCFGRRRYAVKEIGDSCPCPRAVRGRIPAEIPELVLSPDSMLPSSHVSLPRVHQLLGNLIDTGFVRPILRIGVLLAVLFFSVLGTRDVIVWY